MCVRMYICDLFGRAFPPFSLFKVLWLDIFALE